MTAGSKDTTTTTVSRPSRRAYSVPRLVHYGALRCLTTSGTASTAEPGSGNNPNKRA
jgi:hypothetical protein